MKFILCILLAILGLGWAQEQVASDQPSETDQDVPESLKNLRIPKILTQSQRVKAINPEDEDIASLLESDFEVPDGSLDRKGRQFWPLTHFHPGGHFAVPSLLRPQIHPSQFQYHLRPLEDNSRQSPQDAPIEPVARVADTTHEHPFRFAENATPEEERVIVESVNDLIGAVGRQALGAKIYAEPELDIGILPGRPNIEPTEGITSNEPFEQFSRPQECCLFVFFDGSAYYFDDYLRMLTGHYRLMYGTVNGHPHYVARGCKEAELYGPNCSYIWHSNYGWIIGIGTYIGQTKGVAYTRTHSNCPTDSDAGWRYLNKDLAWKENGNIILECAS